MLLSGLTKWQSARKSVEHRRLRVLQTHMCIKELLEK